MSVTRSRLLALAAAFAAPAVLAGGEADVENGRTIFAQRCGICHAVSKEPGGPVAGPSMVGLIGRKAASQPDFAMYSPALKAHDVNWSAETLDEFLVNPPTTVPGTTMPMTLPDEKERGDVIAYLATLK
jgi:cytochrome c2